MRDRGELHQFAASPRSTIKTCSVSLVVCTIRSISSKLSAFVPPIETISPWLKAGRLGGASCGNTIDCGQKNCAPVRIKNAGENDDRQDEIGNWARGNNRRPLSDILGKETDRPLLGRHGRGGGSIRHRDAVGVAMEFDVSAERQGCEPPMIPKEVVFDSSGIPILVEF